VRPSTEAVRDQPLSVIITILRKKAGKLRQQVYIVGRNDGRGGRLLPRLTDIDAIRVIREEDGVIRDLVPDRLSLLVVPDAIVLRPAYLTKRHLLGVVTLRSIGVERA
jgi:hypothetical protein